jgi:glutathione S-transferase
MKLYNSVGPNPRVPRMVAHEKGMVLEIVKVDLRGGENRQPAHLARNPTGTTPTLELDDGSMISEVLAICEYLEEVQPAPPMIGATAKERAETRMWTRRIDLRVCEPMSNGFRFSDGHAFFGPRIPTYPDAASGLKGMAKDGLRFLDANLTGRMWVCGDRFTLADVLLFSFLEFGISVGQPPDAELGWIAGWLERVRARPSAQA